MLRLAFLLSKVVAEKKQPIEKSMSKNSAQTQAKKRENLNSNNNQSQEHIFLN